MTELEQKVRLISENFDEPAWLKKLRKHAWRIFSETPMPSLRYGIGIKTDTSKLRLEDFAQKRADTKIKVDGSVVAKDIHAALAEHEDLIRNHIFSRLSPDKNKFTAFHAALWNTGTLVYAPEGTKGTVRLETEGGMGHVLVYAEPNSTVTILDTAQGGTRTKFVEAFAQEGSTINYASYQDMPRTTDNIVMKRSDVSKDATVNWFDAVFGSRFTLSEIDSYLNEPGADSNIWGIFFGLEEQHFDIATTMYHVAPDTTSDMYGRGVLKDRSVAIYRGLIDVGGKAKRINGYQKEDILLLSNKAKAKPIPKLDIRTNDVRCSHGSTVGQVDENQLFYLMSRGISRKKATELITRGFLEPVLRKIDSFGLNDTHENISKVIEDRSS